MRLRAEPTWETKQAKTKFTTRNLGHTHKAHLRVQLCVGFALERMTRVDYGEK